VYLLVLAVFLAAGAEVIVRKRGWRPWNPEEPVVEVTPGGRFFQKDPILGYTHIPGRFTVTLGDDYSFTATHLPTTLRITHPPRAGESADPRPEIWIFGCSYTYGWSLNDEETYAWLVQQSLPDFEIVNFGVNGYAQIHAFLQIRRALEKRPRPAVAVVTYAGFHDGRNTFSRGWRKALSTWNKLGPLVQPYARLGAEGRLRVAYGSVEFAAMPLIRVSALAHYIELKIEEFEVRRLRSHAVTETLLLEIASLARANGVPLVIAGISEDPPTKNVLRFAEENGIPWVDMSTDLSAPGFRNLPIDTHPSALAHREFARKLTGYLETFLESAEDREPTGRASG
jgi:hypothetical protein